MRFAYLITSHNNFALLQELVNQLDDERNEIFVHYDKKVKDIPSISTRYSRLHILDTRIDVRWGHVSLIKSFFELFREAQKYGPFDFYHILSGVSLPLKTQDFIHSYFEPQIGSSIFRMRYNDSGEADFKIRKIHFGIRNFQAPQPAIKYLVQRFWTVNMFFQKKLGIRINKVEVFFKSECWASLSNDAVNYLLTNEQGILKRYHYALAGDEYYLVSELKKDPSQKIIDDQHLLFVEFELDHPRLLNRQDYEKLLDSDYIFARKFDDSLITE